MGALMTPKSLSPSLGIQLSKYVFPIYELLFMGLEPEKDLWSLTKLS